MEGSGARTRQRGRTLRILSRIKTLRSSGDVMVQEADVENPERKLMVETMCGELPERRRNDERVRPRVRPLRWSRSKVDGLVDEEERDQWRSPSASLGRTSDHEPRRSVACSLLQSTGSRPGTAAAGGKPSEGDSRWGSRIEHCGEAQVVKTS